jgi:hypothetical protein
MSRQIFLVAGLALCVRECAAEAEQKWESKKDEQGRSVQSLKIQAPSMTEEDQYGYTMPDQYRCDACKVVAYHLGEALKARQPTNRRMKEWEYQEVYDEVCQSGLSGYGIALVNGENVLSGPALKRDNLEPGMGAIQMGGETWEKRLGENVVSLSTTRLARTSFTNTFASKTRSQPISAFAKRVTASWVPRLSKRRKTPKRTYLERK